MEKWEFMSMTLAWDAEAEQWKVTSASGSSLRGTNSGEAMNPEGEQGWELVNVVPAVYTSAHKTKEWVQGEYYVDEWSGRSYRAFFKRRKP